MKNKLSLCKQFLASNFSNIFFLLSPLATFLVVEILEYGGSDSKCLWPNQLAFWANILFYYGIFLLFRAVTGRPRFTIVFLNFVFLIFGICNHYSIQIRNEPIVPWDLYAAGTAAEALNGFQWTVPLEIIICSIACLIWWVLTVKFLRFPKQKLRTRAGSLGLSAVNGLDSRTDDLTQISAGVHAQSYNTREETVKLNKSKHLERRKIDHSEHTVVDDKNLYQ